LKIDRSFVNRLVAHGTPHTGADAHEAAVVRSIILLGSSLGKAVVAEGIETESQWSQLRDMGCRLGQGYLMAKPMAVAEVTAMLLAARASQTTVRPGRPRIEAARHTGHKDKLLTSSVMA
jgi:EAL domain-containing protein (putative c-di-GMP-specific phosphodiesterase class I)